MPVPFLDLKVQYQSIKDEIAEGLQEVLDNTAFAGGFPVQRFEENYAKYCGVKECIGVGSGTDALWAALIALGVGPGHEVITSSHTFIATVEAISFVGATPVFVDIDEENYCLDPAKVEAAITDKTKCIIPVHIYGQMADMDAFRAIADKHGLALVEDAAQAHGAKYKGKSPGQIGDAACFSFYPGKNLGAYGEAGAVVTNDSKLADTMRMFRDHGQSKKYYHDMIGWNNRMDGFQGAVLDVKLRHIEDWTEARRANAALYKKYFGDTKGIILPREEDYARHVYHIYCVRVADREGLMEFLKGKDIFTGIHYPVPVHQQKAYAQLGYKQGDLPITEKVAAEIVSLPMFPELSEEQVKQTVEAVKEFLA